LGIRNASFKALPDEEGGLWVFWNNIQNPHGDGRAMHFNSMGLAHQDWPAEGLTISDYSYLNVSRLWDGSVAILNAGLNPAGNASQFKLQYLGEHDPEGASEKPIAPTEFRCFSLFPQPFNNQLKIEFEVPSAGDVGVRLFDLHGREVYNKMVQVVSSGKYSTSIKLENRTTGVYFLNLQFGEEQKIRKVILLK